MSVVAEAPLGVSLSREDQGRIADIDGLAAAGAAGVAPLVERLSERSWAVRRGVVAALARVGEPAVAPLCAVLAGPRDDEDRLAAAVDALVASRAAVEDEVARLADAADPHVVADAAQILGRRRSEGAVPLLARLTAHPDDNVAVAAIEALGRIGGGSAVDALLAMIATGSFFRVFPAIDVLGRSGHPRVVEPLARLLENPIYAPEAARALGRSGHALAIAPLVAQLSRPADTLVRAAALAVAEIHDAHRRQFATGQAVERALRASPSRHAAIRRVAQSVAGASQDEGRALCRILGWIGEEEASSTLLALLDAMPAAAAEALQSVGHEIDERLLAALRRGDSARKLLLLPFVVGRSSAMREALLCLDDPDPAVRAAACEALTRIGDPAAVPALFQRLGEQDLGVAGALVSAIQSLGSAETERLALEAARSPDPRVRRAALRIVAYFGFASGLEPMRDALAEEDERLRDAALAGLPYVDDPRALTLLLASARHPSARTRAAAARALGQTSRSPEVLAALHLALDDEDPWVCYYACQSLGKLGDVGAADAIIRLMEHPAGQVRVAAVEALAHLGTEAAGAALGAAARSGDPDVQRAALVGLGLSRHPRALPLLVEAARSPDRSTRLVALSALAEHESPEVLPELMRAAGDPDDGVREAAVARLAEWSGAGGTHVLIGLLGSAGSRERALEALSLPVPGRVAGLVAALEVAQGELPSLLVSALARMDRPEAHAGIVSALEMTSVGARRAAAEALDALDLRDARPALLRAAEHDEDLEVRRLAALALSR